MNNDKKKTCKNNTKKQSILNFNIKQTNTIQKQIRKKEEKIYKMNERNKTNSLLNLSLKIVLIRIQNINEIIKKSFLT